ncbi:MAG: sensor histidine kinase [Candidatus Eremiobacteraeota bacterium]|nr:sensor histidine kinase [Candidatus Eremiobacteraeota bacterium]MCW5870500.1 sensor histidine kinase [Candidatus Eremiobacteraeota bacterium]
MLFSTKLILLVLFSCLFPTLFMGFQSYLNMGNQVESSTLNLLDSVAQSSAFQVELWLNEQKSTAEAVARSTDVVQHLAEINRLTSLGKQDADEYFLSLYRLNRVIHLCDESSRWFTEVCLVGGDGKLVLTDNGDGFTQAVERHQVDKVVKVMEQGGSAYTSVYPAARPAPEHMESTELSLGFPTMWLMSAVRGEGDSQGVLACRVAVSDANYLFPTEANNVPVDVFLVTHDGWMLSCNRKVERKSFRQTVPCGDRFQEPGHSIEGYQDYAGRSVAGAWQPVPGTNFMVLVQINREIISGPKGMAERSALSVSLGLSLLVATIGFLVAERLLKPLRRLTRAAHALAEGERSVRVRLRRGDEIGDLGDTFDRMAASLETTLLDLEGARDEALAAYRAKSRFLANMTHELRTPLNAIIGYSEMLIAEVGDHEGGKQWVEDLGVIRRSGKDLLALINSILDLSKLEADKMSVDAENFVLFDLLQEVGQVVVPLVREKNNTYVCDYQSADEIRQDRTKLKQVLFNLISNAAKFTKDGSIEVRAEVAGQTVLIQVSDTGIGMSEEQCSKIFDEFAQADESTTRKYGGTGLGLTIVKRFVELMGGSVTVTSQPGAGTTFAITLPAAYQPG